MKLTIRHLIIMNNIPVGTYSNGLADSSSEELDNSSDNCPERAPLSAITKSENIGVTFTIGLGETGKKLYSTVAMAYVCHNKTYTIFTLICVGCIAKGQSHFRVYVLYSSRYSNYS